MLALCLACGAHPMCGITMTLGITCTAFWSHFDVKIGIYSVAQWQIKPLSLYRTDKKKLEYVTNGREPSFRDSKFSAQDSRTNASCFILREVKNRQQKITTPRTHTVLWVSPSKNTKHSTPKVRSKAHPAHRQNLTIHSFIHSFLRSHILPQTFFGGHNMWLLCLKNISGEAQQQHGNGDTGMGNLEIGCCTMQLWLSKYFPATKCN